MDESGSINNKLKKNHDFIVALIVPTDKNKLKLVYKRFVSKNFERLKTLDVDHKMFVNDKFRELKGSMFDYEMKQKFVQFFSKKKHFELFYIRIKNCQLSDSFCENTARSFNYALRLALQYFISKDYLLQGNYTLQLDERNESTRTKFFLEDYLNTELTLGGINSEEFKVLYFDSEDNINIQIADVFANLFYSQIMTNNYSNEIDLLRDSDILKFIFEFPLKS